MNYITSSFLSFLDIVKVPIPISLREGGPTVAVSFSLSGDVAQLLGITPIEIEPRKLNITQEFNLSSLLSNANEKRYINEVFSLSFISFIQLKDRLLDISFILLSDVQYKSKEDHFGTVSSCLQHRNANKDKTLTPYVFKEVSYGIWKRYADDYPFRNELLSIKSMRDPSQLKTPCEFPSPVFFRAVGIDADSFCFCLFFRLTINIKSNKTGVGLRFANFRAILLCTNLPFKNSKVVKYTCLTSMLYYRVYDNTLQTKRRSSFVEQMRDTRVSLTDESKQYYYLYLHTLSPMHIPIPYDEMSKGAGRSVSGQKRQEYMNSSNGFEGAKPGNKQAPHFFIQKKQIN